MVYKKLEEEGKFEETLQKIYHFGRAVNWGIRTAESGTHAANFEVCRLTGASQMSYRRTR